MSNGARDPLRRTLWIIAVAVILPASIVIAMDLSFGLARQRDKIEQKSQDIAEKISLLSDAHVRSDLATMAVLATSAFLKSGEWSKFYERANEVRSLNPGWRSVILTDLAAQREIIDLRRPYAEGGRQAAARFAERRDRPRTTIGNIDHSEGGCRCIPLDLLVGQAGRQFVLTVEIDPKVFQSDIASYAENRFATLVDRDAYIMARWLGIEKRLATRAGVPVQRAVTRGGSGVFFGHTLDGLDTLTAYVVSPLTGWSVHVGVPLALVDQPYVWSLIAGGIALAGAFAIAAFLVIYAFRNLAASRREEARSLQTQKMEAVGRLTGGIAHDFNNLLTVVIGNLELLVKRTGDPATRRLAERAEQAARRGSRLVAHLLAFSRSHELEIVAVDLRALLTDVRDLLEQSLGSGIEITIDVADDEACVMSDANQLELALLNLAINARDAMSGRGSFALRVEAGRAADADHVTMTVTDTGGGMSKEVAARAFEPFFTTKEVGRGTGLGLAQVHGTVSRSGGSIVIETKPGIGTTFRITLPRAPKGAAAAPAAAAAPQAGHGAADGGSIVEAEGAGRAQRTHG